MSRPCSVTPEMLATAKRRMGDGAMLCTVARELGVSRGALGYHLRGGKARHYVGAPWMPHTKAGFRAIGRGQHKEACIHFLDAARELHRYADAAAPLPDFLSSI